MSWIRVFVLCTAIVQIVVALLWFIIVATVASTGTILNLLGLILAGILGIRDASVGARRAATCILNWILVAMWTWGLIAAVIRAIDNQVGTRGQIMTVLFTLAIIAPCVLNGIAVIYLPDQPIRLRRSEVPWSVEGPGQDDWSFIDEAER